jgi:hypothetical protein
MRIVMLFAGLALAAPALFAAPVSAKGPDKYWHLRHECDRHLAQAHSRREFYHRLAECNRKLAKFRIHEQREAAKRWEKAEKKWAKPYKYKL